MLQPALWEPPSLESSVKGVEIGLKTEEIHVLKRKPRWELREWEERGKAVCCLRGEERVELLLGWKGLGDLSVPYWCWAPLVSFPGTWASFSVTATLGYGRKYLLEDSLLLSSSNVYLL